MATKHLLEIDPDGVFSRSQGITAANLQKETRFGIILMLLMASLALWGMFLLAMAVAQAVGYVPVWEKDRFGAPNPLQTATYLVAGGLFGGVGLASLLWRSDIAINPGKKTWRMRRGLLPFVRWHHGRYDDLAGLLLKREITGGRVRHWLYLRWQKGKWQPYRLCYCGSAERVAHRTAQEYAEALHLPVVET